VYSNGEVVIDRISADQEYRGTLEQKLEELYVHYMVPEILSGKIFMEEYKLLRGKQIMHVQCASYSMSCTC